MTGNWSHVIFWSDFKIYTDVKSFLFIFQRKQKVYFNPYIMFGDKILLQNPLHCYIYFINPVASCVN